MLLLLASTAFAEPEYHAELSGQLMPDTVALDLRGRVDGEHDGYVSASMRVEPGGCWKIGRAHV
jgi:hypothetical protein